MKNDCFILYDGLVSFIVLSSYIFFFLLVINIIQTKHYYISVKVEALESLKDNAYYYYSNQKNLKYKEKDFISKEGSEYCIEYKTEKGYEQYCE